MGYPQKVGYMNQVKQMSQLELFLKELSKYSKKIGRPTYPEPSYGKMVEEHSPIKKAFFEESLTAKDDPRRLLIHSKAFNEKTSKDAEVECRRYLGF